MRIYDLSPVRVWGAVSATRARVIWQEGTLHVFTTAGVTSLPDQPEPIKDSGTWTSGQVTWERSGCNCGFTLGRKPRRQLMRMVDQ